MAFTFLNLYIDVVDAVEEDEPDEVSTELFEGTDVPLQFPLPQKPFLSVRRRTPRPHPLQPDEHEEVNEWVLGVSVDKRIEKALNRDSRGCYEASSVDAEGRQLPVCLISGYPVLGAKKELGEGKVVDPAAWHQFVTLLRTQPSEELFDVQTFLSAWTGTAVSVAY